MNYTPKQLKIMKFIASFQKEHSYSPTLKEIAESFGVSTVTVFEHIRTLEKKQALACLKHKSRSIEIIDDAFLKKESGALAVMGQIAAGSPILAVENREEIDLQEVFPPRADTFVLKVKGESMIDDHIMDGDMVIARKCDTPKNGDTVVALVDEHEATLKRFYREKDRVRLEPANAAMEPIYTNNVKIQGVVIGVIRRF